VRFTAQIDTLLYYGSSTGYAFNACIDLRALCLALHSHCNPRGAND